MTLEESFWAYLNEPCETEGCDRTATHNQNARAVCNAHLDPNVAAFARDD